MGKARILIMDDEEIIQDVLSSMLDFLGYESAVASDGAKAIEMYQKASEESRPFDAVIMDLTIPDGVGGMEALAGLYALDPGVRAIVSSCYSNDPIMAEFSRHGFKGVLVKPYRAEDIGRVLREVLGNG